MKNLTARTDTRFVFKLIISGGTAESMNARTDTRFVFKLVSLYLTLLLSFLEPTQDLYLNYPLQ